MKGRGNMCGERKKMGRRVEGKGGKERRGDGQEKEWLPFSLI